MSGECVDLVKKDLLPTLLNIGDGGPRKSHAFAKLALRKLKATAMRPNEGAEFLV